MAKFKEIQNSAELTLDQPQKGLLAPSLSNDHRTPVNLKRPIAPCNFFSEPKSVTRVAIPHKNNCDMEQFEDVFFSQLRDGRLICSYPDGTIALLNYNLPAMPVQYFPILQANKTRAIHELSDGTIVICVENDGNHENYRLNLITNKVTKVGIPAVKVISILSNDDQTAYFGLEDGRLIHWNIHEDKLIKCWHITTTEDNEFENSNLTPEIALLPDLEIIEKKGSSIVCIAQNEDNKLFLVTDVEDGYVTCLFDHTDSSLIRVGFIKFGSVQKLFREVTNVYYSQSGDLTVVLKESGSKSSLDILCINSERKVEEEFLSEKDISGQSAFGFFNGLLAFSGYEPNNVDSENEQGIDHFVEIHDFFALK